MQGVFLRKYGVETTIDFQLFETDGVDFKVDAVHASGDTKIMKNEGAEANTSNGFLDEGQGYSITLTNTEMQGARIVVYIVDQGTKAWLDTALVIETYGHTSAMHAFDLDTSTVTLAAGAIDEIHDEVVEGTLTFRQIMRILLAALAGKSTGGGTANPNFRDNADSKNRIATTVDEDGNRTSVTLDGA